MAVPNMPILSKIPVYSSYARVLADATAGTLKWSDSSASGGLLPYVESHSPSVAQVKAIITAAAISEPHEDWVAGHWIEITTDGKNIIIQPGHLPSVNDPPVLPPNVKVPGINSVTDFLNLLTNGHTWVRVAEFVVGGILIAVGVNAMLKQSMGSGAPQIKPPKALTFAPASAARKAFK